MTEHQIAVVRRIALHALSCEVATEAPAELIAAQCILESGWLDHAPGNNCFGIKATNAIEPRQLLWTVEWFTDEQFKQFLAMGDGRTATPADEYTDGRGRRKYRCQDWFKTFPTLEVCFRLRASLITRSRYYKLIQEYQKDGDLEKYVRATAQIYATADPENYTHQILSIIRDIKPVIDEERAARAAAKRTL